MVVKKYNYNRHDKTIILELTSNLGSVYGQDRYALWGPVHLDQKHALLGPIYVPKTQEVRSDQPSV